MQQNETQRSLIQYDTVIKDTHYLKYIGVFQMSQTTFEDVFIKGNFNITRVLTCTDDIQTVNNNYVIQIFW